MRVKTKENKCWVFNQGKKKFVSNPKIGREEKKEITKSALETNKRGKYEKSKVRCESITQRS